MADGTEPTDPRSARDTTARRQEASSASSGWLPLVLTAFFATAMGAVLALTVLAVINEGELIWADDTADSTAEVAADDDEAAMDDDSAADAVATPGAGLLEAASELNQRNREGTDDMTGMAADGAAVGRLQPTLDALQDTISQQAGRIATLEAGGGDAEDMTADDAMADEATAEDMATATATASVTARATTAATASATDRPTVTPRPTMPPRATAPLRVSATPRPGPTTEPRPTPTLRIAP